MTRYVLSFSHEDEHAADPRYEFTRLAAAEEEFRQIARTGMFVRLIEWIDDQPRELARENDPSA
jgi:hypothetical protein